MTIAIEDEVRSVTDAWFSACARRDAALALPLLVPLDSPAFIDFGLPDENPAASLDVHQTLSRFFAIADWSRLQPEYLTITVSDRMAWVAVAFEPVGGGSASIALPARQTYILEKRGVQWRIAHIHADAGTAAQCDAHESRIHQLEEALQRSEQSYRDLANSLPQTVFEIDLEGNLLFCNDNAYSMWGYDPNNFSGINVFNHVIPEQRDLIRANLRRRIQGEEIECEYQLMRVDGSVFPAVVHSRPVWRDGKPVGLRGFVVDMTERKRLEEEHLKLAMRFQNAQRLESLSILAGGIAHDFNNLLMVILSRAELAGLHIAPDSEAHRHLEQIEEAAQQAANLTNQMLAYSGKGKYSTEKLDLTRLMEEMAHLLKSVVSNNISLHFDLQPNLPLVEADANQVRQVVMSLLTNAAEAINGKTGSISLHTGLIHADQKLLASSNSEQELPAGAYVVLQVSDTGCGMSDETKAKIFDPFFTTKFIGRGLGLAAVLGIVHAHHGAIHVESKLGKGTTIRVLLPCTQVPSAMPQSKISNAVSGRDSGMILVVDDEAAVCQAVQAMLSEMGFTVLGAGSGREALEIFRAHASDIQLVLLDMTMPDMDGEETFRALRALHADMPVLLSSGYSEQDVMQHFTGAKLAGFLQKPYRPAELVAKVRAIIEGKTADAGV